MEVDVDLAQDPPVASIPPGKIAKVKKYLWEVLDAKTRASKDLQFWEELLGILNWMSSVLVSGRFHLAQIVSARRAAAKYRGMIVTKGLQSECQLW
jgi:hypothetical protein